MDWFEQSEDRLGEKFWNSVVAANPDRDTRMSKALAYFMFRGIIEDAHSKYRISQDDMKTMNRMAANRAKFFLEIINKDPALMEAFGIEAIMTKEWDDPVITEEDMERLKFYEEIVEYIRNSGKQKE